ncbi:NuoM family protein [Buchnera aphidicola]|uniref:complex I subunit 4 family protein n=1 Tax=Buchnera aphidicola TaxID=9 RepID=UPI00346482FF
MLLVFLIIIPIIGGIFCVQYEYNNIKKSRWLALFTTILIFLCSILIWLKYFYCINFQIEKNCWNTEFIIPWISNVGINFHLSIDKLSLTMIFLSSILGIISILCSWHHTKEKCGYFYLNLLLMLSGTLGTFLSCDLFLFFCFWELMLIPAYFLIIFWGNPIYSYVKRTKVANRFLIYTQVSSVMMLFSILVLSFSFYKKTHILTFDYNKFVNFSLPFSLEFLIMLGFFIPFIVKIPIFPFHSWLPDLHAVSPTNSSVDISSLLIKVGFYGLLRFNMHLFPKSSYFFSPVAILLGIITVFYASWMAFIETNIKRILAYSSISHMGFILVAIYCNYYLAYQGAILQILFSSFSMAALFILFSQLYQRFHTNNIEKMGGLFACIEWIPSFVLFFIFVNLNFPGTMNFISEMMMLVGIFHTSPFFSYLLIFSLFFSTIYSLNLLHKIFYGPIVHRSLKIRYAIYYDEFLLILFFVLCTLISGLFPKVILHAITF